METGDFQDQGGPGLFEASLGYIRLKKMNTETDTLIDRHTDRHTHDGQAQPQ